MRPPHEIFALTWGDISIKRRKYENLNQIAQPMNIIDDGFMIDAGASAKYRSTH